jgi:tRNA threonylcarbamoyladenosine biosynthesis protein TsaB
LLPVDTLMVVAEEARWQLGAPPNFSVTALLDARMDELYASSYCFESGSCKMIKRCSLIKPEYLDWNGVDVLAGNVFVMYGKRLPHGGRCVTVMPTAAALLRLAPRLMATGACVSADQALPTYIRDKVAQTTLERSLGRTAP